MFIVSCVYKQSVKPGGKQQTKHSEFFPYFFFFIIKDAHGAGRALGRQLDEVAGPCFPQAFLKRGRCRGGSSC